MNKIVFNDRTFDLAVGGVSVTTDSLVLTIADENFDAVEEACAPVDRIVQTLEDGTKVATYVGYTKLISVNKKYNQIIDYDYQTHEEQRPKIDPETGEYVIDPETGEIETETVIVTDEVPVYGTTITVTLFQPTLEDMVADQAAQITEIQEVLAEIM